MGGAGDLLSQVFKNQYDTALQRGEIMAMRKWGKGLFILHIILFEVDNIGHIAIKCTMHFIALYEVHA